MTVPFSDYFLNTFIAPDLSNLGDPHPPDLSNIDVRWLNKFALGSVFVRGVKEPQRSLVVHLLRRVQGAIEEYRDACAALMEYTSVPGSSGVISPYFRALRHFEMCIAQAYQSYLAVRAFVKEDAFARGDGSPIARLLELYNVSKHADERIEKGQIPGKGGSLAVWLAADGLKSIHTNLSYEELATLLTEFSEAATLVLKIIFPPKDDPALAIV